MTPRPLLPWRSVLLLAAAVAAAIPLTAVWLTDDDPALLVLAPSSLAPIEGELTVAMAAAGIGPVEWVFAGSQSLVAQVADGVPADVVLVADRRSLDAVIGVDPTLDGDIVFATNRLVLAVAPTNPGDVDALDDLADPDRLIGVCAVQVPCGRLAAVALDDLGLTVSADTEETSARALTAKIATGELDAGLVYRTDARSAALDVVVDEDLDRFVNTYHGVGTPVGTPVLDFLAGDGAARILTEAGFGR